MNRIMHMLCGQPAPWVMITRLLVLLALLTGTAAIAQPVIAQPVIAQPEIWKPVIWKKKNYDGLVTRPIISKAREVTVRTRAVPVSVALSQQHVALSPGVLDLSMAFTHAAAPRGIVTLGRTTLSLTKSNDAIFRKLLIERSADQLIVTGWRAIQLNSDYTRPSAGEQQRRFFLQEVRITLPYSAAASGWDVRSLERELERLGIKVKPKPSAPRPPQQLRG